MRLVLFFLLICFLNAQFEYYGDIITCDDYTDRDTCLNRCDCGWSAPENTCLTLGNCNNSNSCVKNESRSCQFFRIFIFILAILFLCAMYCFFICLCCGVLYVILLIYEKVNKYIRNSHYSTL